MSERGDDASSVLAEVNAESQIPMVLEAHIRAEFEQQGVVRNAYRCLPPADAAPCARRRRRSGKAVETYRNLVLNRLVDEGHRAVVTSRYEGVSLGRYNDFTILDLEPLSEEQQLKVVTNQIGENKFVEHLLAFSNIRAEHDRIYEEEAFSKDEDREFVEKMDPEDHFLLSSGEFDSAMRQHSKDGSRVVRALDEAVAPKSCFLNSKTLDEGILQELHTRLIPHLSLAEGLNDETIEALVGEIPTAEDEAEYFRKWLVKLAKLSCKTQIGPPELWAEITRRTDEIYVVTEELLPVFEAAARELRTTVVNGDDENTDSSESDSVTIGPMKDPIRIHEKAQDDYKDRFEDGEMPEASGMCCEVASFCTRAQTSVESGRAPERDSI